MTDNYTEHVCSVCHGHGRVWRSWLRRYETCIACDGIGKVRVWQESLRDFRKRVIEGS